MISNRSGLQLDFREPSSSDPQVFIPHNSQQSAVSLMKTSVNSVNQSLRKLLRKASSSSSSRRKSKTERGSKSPKREYSHIHYLSDNIDPHSEIGSDANYDSDSDSDRDSDDDDEGESGNNLENDDRNEGGARDGLVAVSATTATTAESPILQTPNPSRTRPARRNLLSSPSPINIRSPISPNNATAAAVTLYVHLPTDHFHRVIVHASEEWTLTVSN